jgi:hypothetical protein
LSPVVIDVEFKIISSGFTSGTGDILYQHQSSKKHK